MRMLSPSLQQATSSKISIKAHDASPHTLTAPVIGRFAPSPSGRMHLGNVFSFVLAWASACSQGGHMVMRIEDLDPRASHASYAKLLLQDLAWLGLTWEGEVVYQSKRQHLYQNAFQALCEEGLCYPCFCSRAELHAARAPHASDGTYVYPGTCKNLTQDEIALRIKTKSPAWRVKVSELPQTMRERGITSSISFVDEACGRVTVDLPLECGDFLVRRSDGVFAYQFACAYDDAAMGVTEVVRGHDLLSSAARQIYVMRLAGFCPPTYGHLPLLVNEEGRRLSKRDRSLDLGYLQAQGVHPQELLGLVAELCGFIDRAASKTKKPQSISARELVSLFSWEKIASLPPQIVIENKRLESLC